MILEELKKYKKILILGYGKEGKSTERYLKKYIPGCEIGIADKLEGENYLEKQKDYDLVIKTPGIQKEKIIRPYTTATNIFFANKGNNPVIGVTGSKGKSTTSSLISHILESSKFPVKLIGNIGKPALDELLEMPHEKTYFVYELSSYQLDDIQFSPHISVIVSLFPEHMNYHGSESSYYEAKHTIIKQARPTDYYIYNPDVSLLKKWAEETVATAIPFEQDFIPTHLPLLGEHNKSNMRAAITVARLLGIADSVSEKAISSFKALPHRLENIGTYKDIIFYDDAISTTPESTIAAINALPPISTIFLGGEDRGYNFESLIQKLNEKNIRNVVFFPASGKKIKQGMEEYLQNFNTLETQSMEEAVRFAYKYTEKGTICLLSTASPSYSIWHNFEEKGKEFQLYVASVGNE